MDDNIAKLIEKSLNIVKYFQDKESNFDTIDVETILRAFTLLAAYKATLGQALADYQYQYNMMEAVKKHAWTAAFFQARKGEEKVTDTMARTLADDSIKDHELEMTEYRHKLDQVKNLRADIGDVITTLQSVAGQRKEERREANMQGGKYS